MCSGNLWLRPSPQGHEWCSCIGDDVPSHDQVSGTAANLGLFLIALCPHLSLLFLFPQPGAWWMRKGTSLWPTSCLWKRRWRNESGTRRRRWIMHQMMCAWVGNWEVCLPLPHREEMGLTLSPSSSDMTTRLLGNTTGMWRTKLARVMRKTTSSSSERVMEFTTMSWRPGTQHIFLPQVSLGLCFRVRTLGYATLEIICT